MIRFALFRDRFSRTISRHEMSWRRLAYDLQHNTPLFKEKGDCPLISLTEYGEILSPNGSYRHMENARAVYGIEGDYDGGEISPLDAHMRMIELSLKALIVTTPSHRPDAPRWRALLPLARPVPIEARRGLVERLNGAFAGILAPESGTATQCFYIGRVVDTDEYYETHQSFGRCIDEANDISSLQMAISERPREYQTYSNADWNALSREEQYEIVRQAFIDKDGRHEAARRLSVMMAQDGATEAEIRGELIALFGDDTRGGERGQRNLARDIKTLPGWAIRTIGAPKADSMRRVNASLSGLLKNKKQ